MEYSSAYQCPMMMQVKNVAYSTSLSLFSYFLLLIFTILLFLDHPVHENFSKCDIAMPGFDDFFSCVVLFCVNS